MEDMIEYWGESSEYECEVSTLGNVRTLDSVSRTANGGVRLIKSKLLTPAFNATGYLRVGVKKCGEEITTTCHVHKLVAEVHLEKDDSDNKTEVIHIDGNRANNSVENLKWVTPEEYTGNKRTLRGAANPSSKAIVQVDFFDKVIAIYGSSGEAERMTGCKQQNICSCARGRLKQYRGFKWYYASEYFKDNEGE